MPNISCPRCEQAVPLPNQLGATSPLRCPHCQTEFEVQGMQRASIASDDPPPSDLSLPPLLAKSAATSASPPARFQFLDSSPVQPASDRGLPAANSLRRAARGSSAGQALGSLLKIMFGGAAGLAIGQCVLWWLPAPWRTDPLEVAPRLPPVLSFLAPPELREPMVAGAPQDRERGGEATDSPEYDDSIAWSEPAKAGIDAPSGAIESEFDATHGAGSDRPSIGADPSSSVGQLPVSASQLSSSLGEARRIDQWWRQRSDAESARIWYEAVCEVAYGVTYADADDPEMSAVAESVADYFRATVQSASHGARRALLASDGAAWLRDQARDRRGVVLMGRVTEIRSVGTYFAIKIRLADRRKTLATVVTDRDPRLAAKHSFDVDAELIVLGVVLRKPRQAIPDYGGAEAVVVSGGLPIVVNGDADAISSDR